MARRARIRSDCGRRIAAAELVVDLSRKVPKRNAINVAALDLTYFAGNYFSACARLSEQGVDGAGGGFVLHFNANNSGVRLLRYTDANRSRQTITWLGPFKSSRRSRRHLLAALF